jgi:hypothetical protein
MGRHMMPMVEQQLIYTLLKKGREILLKYHCYFGST